jgi:23S rRNA pseudouridine2605 synthase
MTRKNKPQPRGDKSAPKSRKNSERTKQSTPEDTREGSGKSRYSRGGDKPKSFRPKGKPSGTGSKHPSDHSRLNKYLANSGICSRREADELIKSGLVEVNGKIIKEMGYQVKPGDEVKYAGERVRPEKNIYVLLNKPKDYSTNARGPQSARSVLRLLKGIGHFNVLPAGKMDSNSMGLLLFTNDGKILAKLTDPHKGVKQIYHVQTTTSVKREHMKEMLEGVELKNDVVKVDEIEYVGNGEDKKQIGLTLRNNKNQIVKRLFEHLGYKVVKIDRVFMGGITKKDLPRGTWRYLTKEELQMLMIL